MPHQFARKRLNLATGTPVGIVGADGVAHPNWISTPRPPRLCSTGAPGSSSRWGGGVTADEMREMQWVNPGLVAQIRFVERTAEGRRSDKSAREVRRGGN